MPLEEDGLLRYKEETLPASLVGEGIEAEMRDELTTGKFRQEFGSRPNFSLALVRTPNFSLAAAGVQTYVWHKTPAGY